MLHLSGGRVGAACGDLLGAWRFLDWFSACPPPLLLRSASNLSIPSANACPPRLRPGPAPRTGIATAPRAVDTDMCQREVIALRYRRAAEGNNKSRFNPVGID